jgi:hypothetical protein
MTQQLSVILFSYANLIGAAMRNSDVKKKHPE